MSQQPQEVTGLHTTAKSLPLPGLILFLVAGFFSLGLGTWLLPMVFSQPAFMIWLLPKPEFCLPGIITGLVAIFVLRLIILKRAPAKHPMDLRSFCALAGFVFTLSPVLTGVFIIAPQILFVCGLILVAAGVSSRIAPVAERLQSFLEIGRQFVRRIPLGPALVLLLLVFFVEANLASYFLFGHVPHVQDSICQLFHSKIFARGSLTAPAPVPADAFQFTYMIILGGKWYSKYSPGHITLLALGQHLGAPWIIVPLFGTLSVLLLFFLGREMYGRTVGFMSALLALVCPFLIIMSAEFMNHVPTMFFVEAFMLCCVLVAKKKNWLWAALGGSALGYASLIRPLTALALALPFAVYGVLSLIRNRERGRDHAGIVIAFVASFSAFVALFGFYNFLTNGSFLTTGYVVDDAKILPGFGQYHWGTLHTPWAGLVNSLRNLNGLNFFLFGWPIPSLLFVAVAAAKGKTKWDSMLIWSVVSLVAAYFLYWYQDWCFGPRFLFESTAALLLLTVRGITLLPELIGDYVGPQNSKRVHAYTLLLLSICFFVSFTVYWPQACRYFGNSFWGVDAGCLKMVGNAGLKNGVVFVKYFTYSALLPQMSPWLDSSIIYVRDRGADGNKEVMKQFADRNFYIESGRSIVPYVPESRDLH